MRILFFSMIVLIAAGSCRKNASASREEDRASRKSLENQVTPGDIKTPEDPITLGALRLEVVWQESMPEDRSSLVTVGTLIAPGPSYAGHRPEEGDPLIIEGLSEAAFVEGRALIIEVQPPLSLPENEIPRMTLLKIIK